jgi:hypothetical protein
MLPQMNSLIHIKNGKCQKGLMISLQMSLDCFSRLLMESINTCPPSMEDDNGGNAHSTTDCEEDKYVTKFEGMNNTTLIFQSRYNFIVTTLQSILAYHVLRSLPHKRND